MSSNEAVAEEIGSNEEELKLDNDDANVVRVIFEHFLWQFKRVLLLHHGLICQLNLPIVTFHRQAAENCGAPSSLRTLFFDDFFKVEKAYKALLIFLNDIANFYEKTQPLQDDELQSVRSIEKSLWCSLSTEMKENLPKDTFTSQEAFDLPLQVLDSFCVESPSKRLSLSSIREITYLITDKTDWTDEAFVHLDVFAEELCHVVEQATKSILSDEECICVEDDQLIQYFFDFDTQFPDWRRPETKLQAKTPDSGLESAMSINLPENDNNAVTPQPTILSAVPEEEDGVSRRLEDDDEQEQDRALLGFEDAVVVEDEGARQEFPEKEEPVPEIDTKKQSKIRSPLERREDSRSGGVRIATIDVLGSRASDRDSDSRRSRRRSTSGDRGRSSRSSRRQSASPSSRHSRNRSRSRSTSPHRSRHYEDRFHPYQRKSKPLYEATNAPEHELNKNHTRFRTNPATRKVIPVETDITRDWPRDEARRERTRVMGEPRFKKFIIDRPPHRQSGGVKEVWRDHKPLSRSIMHDQTFKLASDYALEHEWSEAEKSAWQSRNRSAFWR